MTVVTRPAHAPTARRAMPAQRAPLEAFGRNGFVEVADAAALAAATGIARRHLASVQAAAHRGRPDAEVHRLPAGDGQAVAVSPLLARLVATAVGTAQRTGGLCDPTVAVPRDGAVGAAGRAGGATAARGGWLPACGTGDLPAREVARDEVSWRDVLVAGAQVTVPGGRPLELRATAIAVALDDLALVAAQLTGADVLVSLGSRAATLGWGHAVTDPSRVLDPRTGRPAPAVWARVEVSAPTCRAASGLAVAAAVLGADAPDWLQQHGAHARLTTAHGDVVRVGSFRAATLPAHAA